MRSWRSGRWFNVVVIGAPVLPILIAASARIVQPALHTGDVAATELDLRDLGTEWWATGAWSRFGFRHPGPALLYLWTPPYRLLGSGALALQWASAVLSGILLASGIVVLLRSRGRWAAVVASASALVLEFALGADIVLEPWNPNPVMAATFAALCGAAAAGAGSGGGAAVAMVAATIGFQAHAGAAVPLVVVVVVLAVALARGRITVVGPAGRPVVAGALVAIVLWIPPLWDQVVGSGNLGRLLRGRFPEPAGWGVAVDAVLRSWAIDSWWLSDRVVVAGEGPSPGWWGAVPVLVLLPIVGAAVAWRHGRRDRVGLMAVFAAPTLVGLPTLARSDGEIYGYLVLWLPVSVVLAAIAGLAAVVATFVPTRSPAQRERVVLGVMLALTAASAVVSMRWTEVRVEVSDCLIGPAVVATVEELEQRGVTGPVVVDTAEDIPSFWAALGVMLEWDRRGESSFGGPTLVSQLRPGRLAGESVDATHLEVRAVAVDPRRRSDPERVAVPIAPQPDGCGTFDFGRISAPADYHLVTRISEPGSR